MPNIFTSLIKTWRCERGSTAVEYALVIALLTMAVMAGVTASGDHLRKRYSDVGYSFEEKTSAARND